MSDVGQMMMCSGHQRRAPVSDYNAGPHYRGPHSLPLRFLLRVQVNDKMPRIKHSLGIIQANGASE